MHSTEFKACVNYGVCNCCFKIGTSDAQLLTCARDCRTSYCSKKCQQADWKREHKVTCNYLKKMTKARRHMEFSRSTATVKFMRQHFVAIFRGIDEKCASTGLEASDIAIEVDFMPIGNGMIPAFQNPPMLIVALRDYLSGEIVPEWCDQNYCGGGSLFKDYLATMGESSSGLLVVHYANLTYFDQATIEKCRQSDVFAKPGN